ncbi:MAG: hypothetical protein JKY49_05025 [Cohaesibacteraceae bacterium]|nr:hypothetical protein [Cohaesibacteraceae bacterium]MBL4876077.1 hypothetical protein [Cohaesibacteraceae bacterium]
MKTEEAAVQKSCAVNTVKIHNQNWSFSFSLHDSIILQSRQFSIKIPSVSEANLVIVHMGNEFMIKIATLSLSILFLAGSVFSAHAAPAIKDLKPYTIEEVLEFYHIYSNGCAKANTHKCPVLDWDKWPRRVTGDYKIFQS